tara:strand:- start:48 stop:236 length:189 start_codon:yes stop_codon:yes gene_type:complete
MKNLYFFLILLTSCSFNNNSAYWSNSLNSTYEEIKYEKDYTLKEYNEALDKYNKKQGVPDLN